MIIRSTRGRLDKHAPLLNVTVVASSGKVQEFEMHLLDACRRISWLHICVLMDEGQMLMWLLLLCYQTLLSHGPAPFFLRVINLADSSLEYIYRAWLINKSAESFMADFV